MSSPTGDKNPFKQQAEAIQKIWSETLTKFSEAATGGTYGTPMPEVLKDLRSSVQTAVSRSWEEFLQSEAFQKSTRAAFEKASVIRESAQDICKKVREETQGITREDLENIQRSIRNAEQLILTRIDLLEARIKPSKASNSTSRRKPSKPKTARKKG